MTALNKQALRYGDNVLWFLNELAAYDANDIDGGEFDVYGEDRNGLEGCSTIDVTELAADAAKLIEAAEKRNAELTEALKQCVIGYKSCLRIGHDLIIDLGGDCDSPGVMISGNPDIQKAEKVLAAGIKIKGE